MNKNFNKEYFNKLKNYLLENYNVTVHLVENADDAWYPGLKKIIINKNFAWRERLISLLHESGHVKIDLDKPKYKKLSFTNIKNSCTCSQVKSKKQFVFNINEELEAWKVGKEICDSLEILIDEKKMTKIITNCIMSYVKYGLKEIYGDLIDIDYVKIK